MRGVILRFGAALGAALLLLKGVMWLLDQIGRLQTLVAMLNNLGGVGDFVTLLNGIPWGIPATLALLLILCDIAYRYKLTPQLLAVVLRRVAAERPRAAASGPLLTPDHERKLRGRLQKVRDRHRSANVHIQYLDARGRWWFSRLRLIFEGAGWRVLDGGLTAKEPFRGMHVQGYKPELIADTVQALGDSGFTDIEHKADQVQIATGNPKHSDALDRINLTLGIDFTV